MVPALVARRRSHTQGTKSWPERTDALVKRGLAAIRSHFGARPVQSSVLSTSAIYPDTRLVSNVAASSEEVAPLPITDR